MNIFLILSMVLINFIFQSTVLPYFSILGVVPNTALILVILISLDKGKYYGGFTGLLIGLTQDLIFATSIGVNAFIYFFIGYIIGSVEHILTRDNLISPVICSIIGTVFYNITYFFFMYFLSRDIPFISFMKDVLLYEILYNCLVAILVYKTLGRVFKEPSLKFGKR